MLPSGGTSFHRMKLTTERMQPPHICLWCWERLSRTHSSSKTLGTWLTFLKIWKIVCIWYSTYHSLVGIKLEAVVEDFPKPLEVRTRDSWMRDTFDIYYGTPEYSRVPCGCRCKNKATCAHQCCKLVEYNVTLGMAIMTSYLFSHS